MEELKCKECGEVFAYEKMSSCKAQLKRHIREVHHMSILDYVVKHEYNGVRPVCPCGCGHELNLSQNGDRWKFTKYYCDTCYGNMVKACNEEVLKQYKETHKRCFDGMKYYEERYDRDIYQKAFDEYKTKQFALEDISKSYHIDKRTLKKVWLALKITDSAELTELINYTKYQLSAINYKTNSAESESSMYAWFFNLIKKFPGKYTIHSAIKYYNDTHKDEPCIHGDEIVLKSMHKIYGDEIEIYLATGYHSSEEYKFYEILTFYLPEFSCKMGKRFILKGEYVYYDFLIGSRLLIEYDSDGVFHNSESTLKNDAEKEKFAKENGYKFLRLSKEDIKKIETVEKIKKILYETNRN